MNPKNRERLADRVSRAAEASLAAQGYVAPLDVLLGIGWLDAGAVKRWRLGQINYLERAVQANLPRISEAMKLFRSWAVTKELLPSETEYLARASHRRRLQFSRSGDPTIERLYRTHWVSPALSERKREVVFGKKHCPRPGGAGARQVTLLRGQDLNLRPSGYEPDELPGCSTPRHWVAKGRTTEADWGLSSVVLLFREEEGRGRPRRRLVVPCPGRRLSDFPFFAGLATTYSPMS